ncbi:unnamed protein product [Kuraishia capsulata CBS 1993]|uniref:MHD domain-containing protein n=1 Tax=Kuraishia capsulata CBS 1993 TaxID=1382522 RepID=W6MI65_9ASCO|nr:uncharacterized protein KUCA_T00001528001 [Kuraishia capsulata CBS 1993]CDK25558.1 unnamed protein product [Kuraishia capsulata CBS 1993]
MASAIYILDENLNQLISRQYKYDLDSSSVVARFKNALAKAPIVSPVLHHEGFNFVYLSYDEIIIMTVCFDNINIMTLASFLQKFARLLKDYFITFGVFRSRMEKLGLKVKADDPGSFVVNGDIIRENYILVYELFDEILDFGVPQLTEFNILKEYIKLHHREDSAAENNDYEDGLHDAKSSILKKRSNSTVTQRKTSAQQQVDTTTSTLINSSISRTSTTKISWRPKGIFYKKNEIFINFNELLRFQYNLETDEVMVNFISGGVDCRSYLSGMPTLTLGLNERLLTNFYSADDETTKNKLVFDNINFHQCVELSHIATNNAISFIPPDGGFTLLNYQIVTGSSKALKPLILVRPSYKIFKSMKKKTTQTKYKLQIAVSLQTNFKRKYTMKKVNVVLPLLVRQIQCSDPKLKDLTTLLINYNVNPKFKTKLGNVVLNLEGETVEWRIPSLDGGIKPSETSDEFKMLCEFELMTRDSFLKTLKDNEYHGKQDKNALFYVEIQDELMKLRGQEGLQSPDQHKSRRADRHSSDTSAHDDFEIQVPLSPVVLSKPLGDLVNQKEKSLKSKQKDLVRVSFELTAMTYSGLKVEYLKIDEPQLHFQSFPWVRYLVESKDGDYLFKLGDSCFQSTLTLEDFDLTGTKEVEAVRDDKDDTHIYDQSAHVSETNLVKQGNKEFSYRGRSISFAEYVVAGVEESSQPEGETTGTKIEQDAPLKDDMENIPEVANENENENDSATE